MKRKREDSRLHVVLLCTANRFRSPLAAAILQSRLAGFPVDVSSRGVNGGGQLAPLNQALRAADLYGVSLATHRSQSLRPGELCSADLLLVFERAHKAAAVAVGGAPEERVFTLPEIVGLLERTDRRPEASRYVDSARALIALTAQLSRAIAPRAAEIQDPFGKAERVFERTAAKIYRNTVDLSVLLRPAEQSAATAS